jgi:hypothetical protein
MMSSQDASSRDYAEESKKQNTQQKKDQDRNNEQVSNKQIRQSGQGTKLHNVDPTKALQEQAKKEDQ